MQFIKFINAHAERIQLKLEGVVYSLPQGATIRLDPKWSILAHRVGLTEVRK